MIPVERFQGCLLGVAIGDALGMPIETYSAEKILEVTGGKGVVGFLDPKGLRKIPPPLGIGQTTDDTELTLVVAESLIRCRYWNRWDCAARHMNLVRDSFSTWGPTTTDTLKALIRGERNLHTPPPEVHGRGGGNGPLMKVSPLGLWVAAAGGQSWFADWVMELSFITHSDPRAGFAAYAGAWLVEQVVVNPVTDSKKARQLLDHLIVNVSELEKRFDNFRRFPDQLSDKLRQIQLDQEMSDLEIAKLFGSKGHSMSSAPLSVALFLRHFDNFREGVLAAVNVGGDTDTHAAIVGSLIGANLGIDGIPEEWRTFRPTYREVVDIATQLHEVASGIWK